MLDKAILLLDTMAEDDRPWGVSELARRTGLAKTSTYRILGHLMSLRLVAPAAGHYVLGDHLHELAAATQRGDDPARRAALPYMVDLYRLEPASVISLGVLDRGEVRYLEHIHGHGGGLVPARTRGRAPLHCTAIGKALLAHRPPEQLTEILGPEPFPRLTRHTRCSHRALRAELAAVRSRGIAYGREEYRLGVTCVAVPLLGRDGHAFAALAVGGVGLDIAAAAQRLRAVSAGIARVFPHSVQGRRSRRSLNALRTLPIALVLLSGHRAHRAAIAPRIAE